MDDCADVRRRLRLRDQRGRSRSCRPREGACALARGARPPKKRHSVLFRSKGDAFAFIDTQRARVSVVSLCRRLA